MKKSSNQINYKPIQHIAFIMDGNGRWAKKRLLPRSLGHKEGVDRIEETVALCKEFGIKAMTLFCFSTENWKRSKEEVDYLFDLFDSFFKNNADRLKKEGCRIRVMGEMSRLPESTQKYAKEAIEKTKDNEIITLNICLNYGGRDEIVKACRRIASEAKSGMINPLDITEEIFENHMMCTGLPPVDVMVRTSGEQRISNFVLWELAYAELIFIDDYWPDFKRPQFIKVLEEFTKRDRRFGGIDYDNK